MKRLGILVFGVMAATSGLARGQEAPPNGPRQSDPRWHALVHATAVPKPGDRIDDATVVFRNGVIVSLTAGAEPPTGARIWDASGRWVYPGWIEPHLAVDAPTPAADGRDRHWNPKVLAQRSALDGGGVGDKARRELRALGFGAAAIAPRGGIFRGSSAVVLLADSTDQAGLRSAPVVRAPAFHTIAFDRGGEGYPRALMGCVALVRQTLLDADHHAACRATYAAHPAGLEPPPANAALAALAPGTGQPLLFDVGHELEACTALRIAGELKRPALILGSGTEFRRLTALTAAKATLILPLNYPETPEVASIADAEAVSLRELQTWEQAPTNPRRVAAAGLRAALTTHRLDKRKAFRKHLRRALDAGLVEDQALAMLTTQPADMLGVADRLGTVESGKLANLIVADGPLFAEDSKILDVWVRGQRYAIHDPTADDLAGEWELTGDLSGLMRIENRRVTFHVDDAKTRARGTKLQAAALDCVVDGKLLGHEGTLVLHARGDSDQLFGQGRDAAGTRLWWRAERRATAPDEPEAGAPAPPVAPPTPPQDAAPANESVANATPEAAPEGADEPEATDADAIPEALPVPLGAFGLHEEPEQTTVVVVGATLWGVAGGRLDDGGLVAKDGKIAWVGPTAQAPRPEGARVIDAKGKHVTPGLIDCHSHTGMRGGLNEGTQAVTAEVRVYDVLDPDDVDWYRQLAGGVTMVNQLHGSANPIGGQSNTVKLRWGTRRPEDMVMRGVSPGIKFALGENVKRTRSSSRYPGSRMGVEALLRDRFINAREYARRHQAWRRLPADEKARSYPPRRDLELDAIAEVLAGIRLIHCHSYRQDEILMLCRLAKEFGFKIGTFQHGLECYKVGEAVREAARGASVFSDWWAYKFEVFDAIPHNGSILAKLGVSVSFNSDSDELARRLNTEAAKAVKYGGTDPETALGFVTSGPAYQLGAERHVGALVIGKDADFAIWSASPLSTYARCEATFVDGRELFSLERDQELRAEAGRERARLLQKALRRDTRQRGGGEAAPEAERAMRRRARLGAATLRMLDAGSAPGECGCHENLEDHR
ncbi:MAG: amidohydrolase family protein [Planctomycetota bacterium]